jgi:glycosyltransferase involved in cell wall biosynthesis
MTADTIGGVWTFATELCARVCARGTRVTLVTFGRLPDAEQRASAQAIENLSLLPTAYRLEWAANCGGDIAKSGAFLLEIAREIGADLVHANTYYHATLPFTAPVLLTAHSCVSSWWRRCKGKPLPQDWKWYEAWVARATQRAGLLVAPSRAYLDEFQAIHGRARESRVICNGRSTPVQMAAHKAPVVLAAGRLWDEAKNIHVLERAAKGTAIRILLAGDLLSPDGGSEQFDGLELLGHLSARELAREMQRAAIFAAPARYEPFGLSILEAARAGCALVLADIPTLRELWDGAAKFVGPDDVDGWRDALSCLVSDPVLAEARGFAARERSLRYSAEAMANAYCEAYAQLVMRTVEGVAA